jgi:hypothetical protein
MLGPQLGVLGDGRNFERWSLLGGLQDIGGVFSKGIVGFSPFFPF